MGPCNVGGFSSEFLTELKVDGIAITPLSHNLGDRPLSHNLEPHSHINSCNISPTVKLGRFATVII